MMEGWRQTHGNAYARIVAGLRGPIALEPVPSRRVAAPTARRQASPTAGPRPTAAPPAPCCSTRCSTCATARRGAATSPSHRQGRARPRGHRPGHGHGEYLARFFSNNATPKAFITIPGRDRRRGRRQAARDLGAPPQGAWRTSTRSAILDGGMTVKAVGRQQRRRPGRRGPQHGRAQDRAPLRRAAAPDRRDRRHRPAGAPASSSSRSASSPTTCGRSSWSGNRRSTGADVRPDAPRFYFEFNLDGLLRGDFKTRMEGYALLIQWGLCHANEIRRLMNLPPVEGGDERLHPLNMVPASRIMDVLLKTTPAARPARPGRPGHPHALGAAGRTAFASSQPPDPPTGASRSSPPPAGWPSPQQTSKGHRRWTWSAATSRA
jgi:hypothetical protein